MVALAAGDGHTARRFANQAENLLSDTQPLTMLLSAHSAQLQGDKRSAEKYFLSMLDLPEMEFLGLRGLILQAGKDSGERPLLLARRAFAINPRASWVISALYELEARAGNWSDAARTIENAIKKNVSDIDEYIVELSAEEGLSRELNAIKGGVSLHLACHSRAQNIGPKASQMLKLIPDTKIDVIEKCSGHGGSWGVKKENFDTAFNIGKGPTKTLLSKGNKYVSSTCPLAAEHIVQIAECEKKMKLRWI